MSNKKIPSPQPLPQRIGKFIDKLAAVTRVSGLLLSVISMHLLIIRPLVNRVDSLQLQLNAMQRSISKVAQENSHLEEANDLLSNLKAQHDEIAGARATMEQLRKLREEALLEANRVSEAAFKVNQLSLTAQEMIHQQEEHDSELVANVTPSQVKGDFQSELAQPILPPPLEKVKLPEIQQKGHAPYLMFTRSIEPAILR